MDRGRDLMRRGGDLVSGGWRHVRRPHLTHHHSRSMMHAITTVHDMAWLHGHASLHYGRVGRVHGSHTLRLPRAPHLLRHVLLLLLRNEWLAEHVDWYEIIRMSYRAGCSVLSSLHLVDHLIIGCTGDVLVCTLRGAYLRTRYKVDVGWHLDMLLLLPSVHQDLLTWLHHVTPCHVNLLYWSLCLRH